MDKIYYTEGSLKPIFLNYQDNEGLLGYAKLKKYIGKGLPFILEDSPNSKQIVYNTEKWLVEFIDSKHYNPGFKKVVNLRIKEENNNLFNYKEIDFEPSIVDKFLEVDGKEIY